MSEGESKSEKEKEKEKEKETPPFWCQQLTSALYYPCWAGMKEMALNHP